MRTIKLGMAAILGVATALSAQTPGNEVLVEQVRRAETEFAKTMADRDRKAFASFLSADAVFMTGIRVQRRKEKGRDYPFHSGGGLRYTSGSARV